jgi:hypothetical protein
VRFLLIGTVVGEACSTAVKDTQASHDCSNSRKQDNILAQRRTQAYLANGLVVILKLKTGALLNDVTSTRNKLEHACCDVTITEQDGDELQSTSKTRKKSKGKKSRGNAGCRYFSTLAEPLTSIAP